MWVLVCFLPKLVVPLVYTAEQPELRNVQNVDGKWVNLPFLQMYGLSWQLLTNSVLFNCPSPNTTTEILQREGNTRTLFMVLLPLLVFSFSLGALCTFNLSLYLSLPLFFCVWCEVCHFVVSRAPDVISKSHLKKTENKCAQWKKSRYPVSKKILNVHQSWR